MTAQCTIGGGEDFCAQHFSSQLGRHVRDVVGHGSLIKVMAYILGIILPKCHCMHFNPYLVKLISVKFRSSVT